MAGALSISGLRKSYGGRHALDGLDLHVPAGSIFGLVGANGAGKTTMMSICAGLLQAEGGRVDLFGDGPFDPVIHAGRVAILPQDSRLPLHARVVDLLTFYGRLQGIPKREVPAQIEQMLAWVNLSDRARSQVKSLSHGMMRRLTIAQAFLGAPEIVFLDEPMSGLDPHEVARIRESLIRRRGRQTVIISSHVLSEIEAICDSIAFIDKGRRVKQGSLSSIVRRHQHITYSIRTGSRPPLEKLRDAVTDADWKLSDDGTELSAALVDGVVDPSVINAKVLPVLLAAEVGVVSIRHGSDLEREFFSATKPHG